MENYAITISSISLFIAILAYIESKKNDHHSALFWKNFHDAVSSAIRPHVEVFSQRLDRIERFVEKKSSDSLSSLD